MSARSRCALSFACTLLGACTGDIAGGSAAAPGPGVETRPGASGAARTDTSSTGTPSNPSGDPVSAGAGGPSAAGSTCSATTAPPVGRLRKLTATQYRNTVRDLVAWAVKTPADGTAVMNELAGALGSLAADRRIGAPAQPRGGYRRMDQDLQQNTVDVAYQVGTQAGKSLTTAKRIGVVVGACATDATAANDGDCIDGFIATFGERALRRPLTADEKTLLRGVYGTGDAIDPVAFGDVITVLLSMPQFMYQVEHGDAAVAGKPGVYTLSAFELASRLSYQFWQTMPDEALWQSARSGALLGAAELGRQIDRLLADPRARATLDEFVTDWFQVDDLPPLDALASDAKFKAFAGDLVPSKTLRQAMVDEVRDLARDQTWTRNGGVDDLFTTELAYPRTDELARLYGVPRWDGTAAPPPFPAGTRPGVQTRAALLSTGSPTTRPIMKGVFLREAVLCDEIPPPPDNAKDVKPTLKGAASTRQIVASITETPGTACAACHATIINPLGYATENFDALGRLRQDEAVFDDKGALLGRVPVDTRSVLAVVPGDTRPSNGAADLARQIVESKKPRACFARNYLRFTFGRWDDPGHDACVLDRLRAAADRAGGLQAVLREVALSPEFAQRTFQ